MKAILLFLTMSIVLTAAGYAGEGCRAGASAAKCSVGKSGTACKTNFVPKNVRHSIK